MNGKRPELGVDLGFMRLKNPVITASGTFGYGEEYKDLVDLNGLGGIVVKGLSLEPKEGNPPPRIIETPCGMLNAIGLANPGLKAFIEKKVPFLETLDTSVIVNIYGHSLSEYGAVAAGLKGIDAIDALEVNISCPNVEQGGMAFGTDPDTSARVTEEVLKKSDKPVIVKLSPNVTDIRVIAKAVQNAGAHAVSLINTLTGMSIDIESGRPELFNRTGGLSGPAIRPVAVHMVYQVAQAVDIPVIGMGGIIEYRDALEFLIAGARAVQVGTANFVMPGVSAEIIRGMEGYLREKEIPDINGIIGTVESD